MKTRKNTKTTISNDVIIEQQKALEEYHFTFDICELTKDGYFKIQWHVQEF